MNLIVICLDSFRQDHVSFYHQGRPAFEDVPPCQTPNIDDFARDCVVFTHMYPSGLPTIPIRMELMTGQFTLPCRPWQPLSPYDITIAQILRREDYVCGLISDTYHYRAPNMNYHRAFNSYEWIRGQEYDPYESAPSRRPVEDYVNEHYDEVWRGRVAQFLANTDGFVEESHWFPAQVVERACEWLKKNRVHDKVFLWIDSFDPHEPWDPPANFDVYTDPHYKGPRLIMPMGGNAKDWATPEQIRYIRGLYAGESAFVDHCLRPLFETLREEGYYEDSWILLFADHGHPLADHGKFLKGPDRMYSELLKVPFMIRPPDRLKDRYPPRVTHALGMYPDVLPTLFELLGLRNNLDALPGRSLVPLLRGEREEHRDAVICGYHQGVDRCIRDKEWSYIVRPEGQSDELYYLVEDPKETHNRIDEYPTEAQRLARRFGSYWRQTVPRVVKGIQGTYELSSAGVD